MIAEGIIASLLAMHGSTFEWPARGEEYEESAASLNDAISELTASIADGSYWEGTAADAYSDLLQQLITQLQAMSDADLRIHETLSEEAEFVVYARGVIGAMATAVGIAMVIAWALPEGITYEYQGSIAALTVSIAASTTGATGLVSSGSADTISQQAAIYAEAAAAAQAASGSPSDTSDGVSVDTEYLDQLASQLTTAESDVEEAASDVDGLVGEVRNTHGVVCHKTMEAVRKAQRAYKNACATVAQRIDDTSTALTDAAAMYENTDEEQSDILSDEFSELEVPSLQAASEGIPALSALSGQAPVASLTGSAAQRVSGLDSTGGTVPGPLIPEESADDTAAETVDETVDETTSAYSPTTPSQIASAPRQFAQFSGQVAQNNNTADRVTGRIQPLASMAQQGQDAEAASGTEGAERAPVDLALDAAEGAWQPRPAERIA